MRRRLALTVLVVTLMVAIAFVLPLAFAVRVMAADRSLSEANRESRTLAGVLATVSDRGRITTVVDQLNTDKHCSVQVILPTGERIGAPLHAPDAELALAISGRAFTASSHHWTRVWVPVRLEGGATSVGVVALPNRMLHRGVFRDWLVLAGVGALVVALGVLLADRLGHSMVVSLEEVGAVTSRLQQGDLDARVVPGGPPEVAAVGQAVNQLAERIDSLLADERESAADLSHRLRTPLAALQLEADSLRSTGERLNMTAAVGDLADAVSSVIRETRQPRGGRRADEAVDLSAVVRERLAFWAVLAEDQGRHWGSRLTTGAPTVSLPAADLAAAVDALLANVFTHTSESTPFSVVVSVVAGAATLVVDDAGPGLPSGWIPVRGTSGSGSTGLGLDIVRRTAERTGGRLLVGRSALGGVRVEVRFGSEVAPRWPRRGRGPS